MLTIRVYIKFDVYHQYWFSYWPKGFNEIISLTFSDDNIFCLWADINYPNWRDGIQRTEVN